MRTRESQATHAPIRESAHQRDAEADEHQRNVLGFAAFHAQQLRAAAARARTVSARGRHTAKLQNSRKIGERRARAHPLPPPVDMHSHMPPPHLRNADNRDRDAREDNRERQEEREPREAQRIREDAIHGRDRGRVLGLTHLPACPR